MSYFCPIHAYILGTYLFIVKLIFFIFVLDFSRLVLKLYLVGGVVCKLNFSYSN